MQKQANTSIGCTVSQCVHHCKEKNYCSLEKINVGTHELNPKVVECTDCESFRPDKNCCH
ncbi:MAG: DUF1540 domain-containing protein [Oscillospiraceae bacterium]|nr:DUF1540 domain-containing protein [Oscillospiraceae bacterium]MBQ8732045.1 DUF1540 domain-containing protein [Oscillospiraceae bacterium]